MATQRRSIQYSSPNTPLHSWRSIGWETLISPLSDTPLPKNDQEEHFLAVAWLTQPVPAVVICAFLRSSKYEHKADMLAHHDNAPCFSGRSETAQCVNQYLQPRKRARQVRRPQATSTAQRAPSNGPVTSENLEAPDALKHVERVNPLTDKFEVCPLSGLDIQSLPARHPTVRHDGFTSLLKAIDAI